MKSIIQFLTDNVVLVSVAIISFLLILWFKKKKSTTTVISNETVSSENSKSSLYANLTVQPEKFEHDMTGVKFASGYDKMTTRAFKNNNPLNIKIPAKHSFKGFIGNDGTFCKFIDMPFGYRAAIKLLWFEYYSKGDRTITDIITRWAPSNENRTTDYILFVSKDSGIDKDTEFEFSVNNVSKLISAMSQMEWSNRPTREDLLNAWALSATYSDY